MIPKPGEVYLVDLGMAGKVRPVVIVTREDASAPRALSVTVPLTTQNRGTQYEVQMPRVPWLKYQSFGVSGQRRDWHWGRNCRMPV